MAETHNLTQGSWTLNIDDGTNYEVKRVSLTTPAPAVLTHAPDFGPREAIRIHHGDRQLSIEIRIVDTSAESVDTVLNNRATLERWLYEAARYEVDRNVDKVYYKYQPDTATNATQHRIRWGWVEDIQDRKRTTLKYQGKVQLWVTLNAILEPYGEWTSTITLANRMYSSPHMVEESDGDNLLADGWNNAFTAPTATISTFHVIGGQSQKVVTNDADSSGIFCDSASADAASNLVAYVWVWHAAGDPVRCVLTDGAAVSIQSKTLQNADAGGVSDKSYVDSSGNTWYRVSLSGSNSAADARIYVYRHTNDATVATTFYVDGAYIATGTTVPDAWMSGRRIDNRCDIQATNQASENLLNYIDVWGVPGDAPALIDTEFDWTTAAAGTAELIAGSVADGALLAADEIIWLDSDERTSESAGNGSWTGTDPADANRTNGSYAEFTDGGSGLGIGSLTYTLSGNSARSLFVNPKRAFVICRSSSTATTYHMEISTPAGIVHTGAAVAMPAANEWNLIDLGLVNGRSAFPLNYIDATGPDISFVVKTTTPTASATSFIDAIQFVPASHEFMIFDSNTAFTTSLDTHVRGSWKHIIHDSTGASSSYNIPGRLGTLWTVMPGTKMTRFVYATNDGSTGSNGHSITNAAAITLTITPRTRHLIGTK